MIVLTGFCWLLLVFIWLILVNFLGDELLDEVCGDLQQRVQHIKAFLGEQLVSTEERPYLVLQNKTPFWNETNQVYQVT